VAEPPDTRSPLAIALEWSATIMTISAEMVVPGLIGYWIDQWLGTQVLFLLLGFALGGTMAALALVRIAKNHQVRGGATSGSAAVGGARDGGVNDHAKRSKRDLE